VTAHKDIPAPSRGRLPRLTAIGWIFVVLLVVVWQWAASAGWYSTPIVPAPATIVQRWWALSVSGDLWPAVGTTLWDMLIGYLFATVVGILLGVLMARIRLVNAILEPIVELIRPVPVVAIVPLLILFLGIGATLKMFAVFLAAVFPILIGTLAGISSVSPTMRHTADTFGLRALPATCEVYFPAALPNIFVGLRTALSLSIVIAVLSEMIAGNTGIGYLVVNAEQSLDVTALYAQVATLAIIGYLANILFLVLQRVVLFWAPDAREMRR
jgi:ABC-type nitrate/sulfonate/bicarbonate transport system permease component